MVKEKGQSQVTSESLNHSVKDFQLTEGRWTDGTPWRFIISEDRLDPQLCTAVFCITTYQNKLLLVEHKTRGWELPGGHIDEGETIQDALEREVLEETGAVVKNAKMFGYKKISPEKPVPYRDRPGQFYPFPHSYIPYYVAEASEVFNTELATDVIRVKQVDFEESKTLFALGHNHSAIIDYLINNSLIK